MKKFIKATPKDCNGSSFDGYLIMPYDHLAERLGEPHDCTKEGAWRSGDNKVRAEWAFKSRHRKPTVITIYDYKEPLPVKDVTMWHVGIKGKDARFVDFFVENNLGYPQASLENRPV
jgi:hypothetical protein